MNINSAITHEPIGSVEAIFPSFRVVYSGSLIWYPKLFRMAVKVAGFSLDTTFHFMLPCKMKTSEKLEMVAFKATWVILT